MPCLPVFEVAGYGTRQITIPSRTRCVATAMTQHGKLMLKCLFKIVMLLG